MQGRHPKYKIFLSVKEKRELQSIVKSRKTESSLVQRARIILFSSENKYRNTEIGDKVGCNRDTVRKWKKRFKKMKFEGLKDDPRSGCPIKFTSQERSEILAMATRSPESEGKHFTDWTIRDLTSHIIEKKIVKNISWTTIFRWLRESDIKPHKWEYWLNSKDPDFKKNLI